MDHKFSTNQRLGNCFDWRM